MKPFKFDTSYLKQFTKPTEEHSDDSENQDLIKSLNLDDESKFIKQVQPTKNRSITMYSNSSANSSSTNYTVPLQLEQSMSGSSIGKEDLFYKTMPTSFQQFQFKNKRRFEPQTQTTQFQISIPNILKDGRTTLMIKNIPNKYTQPLLLERIDKNHKDTYDFIYLPIDFMNKCNVGYAFINFINAKFIKNFYLDFHDKKWDMFNSDKICQITYGRIQGVEPLQSHFQYSTIMQEKDKQLKPVFKPVLKKQIQDQRNKKK